MSGITRFESKQREVHTKLVSLLGDSKSVYFTTESLQTINHPCFIYSFGGFKTKDADNKKYIKMSSFVVVHVYKDFSDNLVDNILDSFDCVSFDKQIRSGGYYNDTYTILI